MKRSSRSDHSGMEVMAIEQVLALFSGEPVRHGEFDIVVAMYHDQGHIPMKLLAFDSGVNVGTGLPIIRTSVDHGTAFDIAGSGRGREDSLLAAIDVAMQMVQAREQQ